MNAKLLFFLSLALLWAMPVGAQPQTPSVYLNEKLRLCELAVGQRAILRFDLRPIGGQRLKVELFKHDQKQGEAPIREWIIEAPAGQERLSFKDLPRAVYRLVAYACDENGQALAYSAPLVHVEYGGWRAWEAFRPPVEVVTTPPPTFDGVDVATNIRNRDVQIAIDPGAVVVRPGGEVALRAGFSGTEPERLKWTLVGEGKLKAVDEYHYVYTAPDGLVGSKLVRVEIHSIAHPDLVGTSMILVTNADPESLNSVSP
jgi:hypothetical protein